MVASRAQERARKEIEASQSPSLRGSGRFPAYETGPYAPLDGLNPLHCGAVVASARAAKEVEARKAGLNPLHCGAVVASPLDAPRARRIQNQVSIPFIAGQWSLQIRKGIEATKDDMSQSPSLRGSGRFSCTGSGWRWPGGCLNPLHCGAVVASRVSIRSVTPGRASQSPSLRGSGRFPPRTTPFPFCRVLLRKRRLPCDHIICTRLPF